jgi:transcriptional regulator with XRE-family HTH domain
VIKIGNKSQHYREWIPATIQILRESAGLTQTELAKKAGFEGSSSISHFESGARLPTIDNLDAIFTACGVTLVIGYEPKHSSQILSLFTYVRKDSLRAIVDAVAKIDPDLLENYKATDDDQ